MASQKEKLIAEALKLVEKGQYERAVKVYLKVVGEDDKDVRIWLKVGDLYTKLRRNAEAAETYLHVAQAYSEQGFYTKAIAVFKQILKLDPSLVHVHEKLADLYRQMGLIPDAIDQYSQVAAYHGKEGNAKLALASLKQIVELDPQNVATRVKLAELYSREQMVREAIDEFARAAEHLHEQGRFDDYMKVAERLLFHSPDNRPVSRELARLYLERGDARKALPRLQVCFKADPRDGETLSLLAEAFRALGQTEKAVSVLKELARIQLEIGAGLEREDTFRRILELNPQDPDARTALPDAPEAPPLAAGTPPSRPPQRRAIERPTVVDPPPLLPRRAIERATVQAPRVPTPAPSAPSIPVIPGYGPASLAPPSSPSLPSALAPTAPSIVPPGPPQAPGAPSRFSRLAPTQELTGDAADASSRSPASRQPVTRSDFPPSQPLAPMATMPPQPVSPLSLSPSLSRAPSQPRVSPPSSGSFEPPPVTEEELRKILAETDVFAKYNLHAKAIEHIRTVFDRDPTHVPAREKLKSLLLAVGRRADALEELRTLAHNVEGQPAESGYLDEMLEIDPSDVWARGRREMLLVLPQASPALEAGRARARGRAQSDARLPAHVDVDLSDVEVSEGPSRRASTAGARGPETPRPLEAAGGDDEFAVVVDEGPSQPPSAAGPIEDRFGEDLDALGEVGPAAAFGRAADTFDLATPPPPSLPSSILASGLDSVRPVDNPHRPHQPPTPNRFVAAARADLGRLRPPGVLREVMSPTALLQLTPAPRRAAPTAGNEVVPPLELEPLPGPASAEPTDEATPVNPPAIAAAPAGEGEATRIGDILNEVEFFLSQGIVADARAAIEAGLVLHPDHPLLVARLAELPEATLTGSMPPPASHGEAHDELPPPGEITQSVRMDELLRGEREAGHQAAGPDEESAASVQPKRRNVVEMGVSADDFASHFDLGIAYKEMGLLDDAIVEFKIAARDPTREVQGHQMIGLCYLDKGRAHDAVRHFKQGLCATRILEDEELSLHYELGMTYERIGDRTEALYYYERIRKRKPRYRDVERRVEGLVHPAAVAAQTK